MIGSSRSRSNGTAGQGKGWCILLAAMQVNYVPTSALEQRFPVFLFFWVVFGESSLVRLTYCYLDVRTYVIAITVGS